jgi:uncharacterized membrane protein
MEVSSGFLFAGVALVLVGVYLVYLSLRAGPGEADAEAVGVILIGPIPIIVGGGRKWIIAALAVIAVIMLYMVSKQISSNLIGW